jgi:hypothetical protein
VVPCDFRPWRTSVRAGWGRTRQADVGHGQKVGLELWVNVEARGGARHSTADRTCLRHRLSPERQTQVASGGTRRRDYGSEDGGDLHPPLAAHWTACQVYPRESKQQRRGRFRLGVFGRWVAEEVPASSQRVSPCAIREQTEVANAHEAARDDV